ncbi:MAG: FtsQ-type POTRA domain-containing protein [Deltaproteobacteria bacterium]|nr:FtsQ-type POTRA domain-containing protein [Deltaproteobacteria bacterium]NIS78513.1 FtsQ-type POTRA domain-containing protein [Deltaproteobacteria bacterium]
MTVLEYKRYKKKSLNNKRRALFFGKRNSKRSKNVKKGGRLKYMVLTIGIGAALVVSGKLTHSFFTTSPLFAIADLKVVKEEGLKDFDFEKAAGLDEKGSLFGLDLEEVADAFKKNPWVEEVAVRKVFPGKLVVTLSRRKPVAMLNLDGLHFVDARGRIFKKVTRYDSKVYPVITGFTRKMIEDDDGRDTLLRSLELRRMLKGSVVEGNVSEINYSPREGSSLVLKDSGLRIKLGSSEIKSAFARLEKNYDKITHYRNDAVYVDLKYPGKIFVGKKKDR